MSGISIKSLPVEQIMVIEPLWKQLNDHHLHKSVNHSTHFRKQSFRERLNLLSNRDVVQIFVCYKDEQIVGYCLSSVSALTGEVDSLYVDKNNRGNGIGGLLMEVTLKWLEDYGAIRFQLSVVSGNEEAYSFYEKYGFKPYYTMLRRNVGE